MNARARMQLWRAIRLPAFVLISLLGTAFLHTAAARYPAAAAAVGALEILWRAFAPVDLLPAGKEPTPQELAAIGQEFAKLIHAAMTPRPPVEQPAVPATPPPPEVTG